MFRGETGAIPLLVPTRFVWPHGGRLVYLCGSFTGWQDTQRMSPVDGSGPVFQVVLDLPPGYHQYKFIVDGEWRHDEGQTCMPDPHGNVNNWLLVREQDAAERASARIGTGTGSMEVDHPGTARPQLPVACTAVSAAEAEASRQRISDFLLRHSSAYDLLPQSGKVVTLDVTLPVRQAFHALYEQGVSTAPLWDSATQQFVGMLTASDFILILRQLWRTGAVLADEPEADLDAHSIAGWKQEKSGVARELDERGDADADGDDAQVQEIHLQGPARPRPALLYVGPDCSLRGVADILLQHQVATVPVLDFIGPVPELLHLACLSGILKCICRHFRHVAGTLPLLSESIGALQRFQRLGTWVTPGQGPGKPLAMLRPSAPLVTALSLLLEVRISAVPIVDDNGCLLDVYTRSDITGLAKDQAYAHRPVHELTVAQALLLRSDPAAAAGACQICRRSDTLRSVIERLALPGVRRLICVEEGTRRVLGVVSLRDVFHFLLA